MTTKEIAVMHDDTNTPPQDAETTGRCAFPWNEEADSESLYSCDKQQGHGTLHVDRHTHGSRYVTHTPTMPVIVAPAARTTDPGTSHAAARHSLPAKQSLAVRVLGHYGANEHLDGASDGLTAREVEAWSGVRGAWKRVSDLSRLGFITPVVDDEGREVLRAPRPGDAKSRAMRITGSGREYLALVGFDEDRVAVEADIAAGMADTDVEF